MTDVTGFWTMMRFFKKILLSLIMICATPLCLEVAAGAKESIQPKPMNDGRVQMPEEWRRCKLDSECVGIHYGCGSLAAVHESFETQAATKAYKEGGDPRAMSCLSPHTSSDAGPIEIFCRGNRCGAFQYPACRQH